MANFFDGQFNVRSLLPAITNNAFIWDSFPDTTLGGLITGLTETNLGKAFLKHPHGCAVECARRGLHGSEFPHQ